MLPYVQSLPTLIPIEDAVRARACVLCGDGGETKEMTHRCGGLTHNSKLGFESLLGFV